MVRSRKPVPVKTSLYMRYLFQDKGMKGRQLLKTFPNYRKSTIYRHVQLPIDAGDQQDKRECNKGRPRKLTALEERNLVRELQKLRATVGAFSAARLQTEAGISPEVSVWTIRRALKRHGYSYLHSHKKGLLTARDLRRRYQFACKIKRLLPSNFWDATSFVHKTNLFDQARATKTMAWGKKRKGLVVRQIEADILTISRGNSILVLSCSFKVSKYISECCLHRNFLWALANTFLPILL